jgi:uncharacterized membrane protein (DUF373 family)
LVVLIAIEIFINITLYIRSDVIPVKLVVATALMAISRKIIVFDYKHLDPAFVSSSALVVFALGITGVDLFVRYKTMSYKHIIVLS